jgi:hypothetical protein
MGKLFIPGERSINGPWFIGIQELEELDEIFEFAFEKISESLKIAKEKQAEIDVEKGLFDSVEKALSRKSLLDYEDKKKVELISSNGKKLIDDSLKGILKDTKLLDFKPKELTLEIGNSLNRFFLLKISRRYDGELTYSVKFHDQDCSEEIIYKIENWLEKHQPTKMNTFWSQSGTTISVFSIISAIILSSFIYTKELPDFKTINKNEINKIIKSGVTKDNELKSIELLLKYSTEYKPENIKEVTKLNKRPIQFFGLALILFFLGIFRPITTIGLGEHKTLLKRYKIYTKFVLITLPAIFIIPPMIEWLKGITGI